MCQIRCAPLYATQIETALNTCTRNRYMIPAVSSVGNCCLHFLVRLETAFNWSGHSHEDGCYANLHAFHRTFERGNQVFLEKRYARIAQDFTKSDVLPGSVTISQLLVFPIHWTRALCDEACANSVFGLACPPKRYVPATLGANHIHGILKLRFCRRF